MQLLETDIILVEWWLGAIIDTGICKQECYYAAVPKVIAEKFKPVQVLYWGKDQLECYYGQDGRFNVEKFDEDVVSSMVGSLLQPREVGPLVIFAKEAVLSKIAKNIVRVADTLDVPVSYQYYGEHHYLNSNFFEEGDCYFVDPKRQTRIYTLSSTINFTKVSA